MKKIFSIVAIFSLLIILSACDQGAKSNIDSNAIDSSMEEETINNRVNISGNENADVQTSENMVKVKDGSVDITSGDNKVNTTTLGAVNAETKDAKVSVSEDGGVKIETPGGINIDIP